MGGLLLDGREAEGDLAEGEGGAGLAWVDHRQA
jgi:hypothetical protein